MLRTIMNNDFGYLNALQALFGKLQKKDRYFQTIYLLSFNQIGVR